MQRETRRSSQSLPPGEADRSSRWRRWRYAERTSWPVSRVLTARGTADRPSWIIGCRWSGAHQHQRAFSEVLSRCMWLKRLKRQKLLTRCCSRNAEYSARSGRPRTSSLERCGVTLILVNRLIGMPYIWLIPTRRNTRSPQLRIGGSQCIDTVW